MEKTLISRNELAKRWGVTTRTIINYEESGIITRNPNFDKPFYYLEEIQTIDNYKPNPLSHFERKRLENENKELKDRINALESILSKVVMVGTESMNILTNLKV
ncbi:transcription factor [uncultured Clostridium sp.]|uniref:transcription factor n=1 Tax=uncultured Clostridium sp. TaxID=59620 RepID=UPI0025DD9D56|nr:transcription factor [uncultured Clostridium sp.]